MKPAEPVSSIRNIGPASVAPFARAGIHSADELREMGPDAAYRKLLAAGSRPHFIGYYALVMGLQGRPWNDCKGPEKEALRLRFDKIKSETSVAPLAGIEKILDEIGVRKSD
ncbi:TfoX/Sxy family protein [Falsihalocynthiibacter sp. SS001]|uniref:TfoX/Sxy family protein n=1 Tax=Falsihalocynthiibacter sp. SS001 TaxID=3349698 RepID=UPI0036D3FCB4